MQIARNTQKYPINTQKYPSKNGISAYCWGYCLGVSMEQNSPKGAVT